MTSPAPVRIHPELPIFWLEQRGQGVLYTPGHVAVARCEDLPALRECYQSPGREAEKRIERLAGELEKAARVAREGWNRLADEDFSPECLTVYLSNACNLQCAYCYSAEADGSRITPAGAMNLPVLEVVDERKVLAAAELVAESCANRGKPFHLVVHGGGEPTLHWERLTGLVEQTRALAGRHGIGWWGYLATHGVIAPARAEKLAGMFDLVGVSCDGPPDIHDRQRPSAGGGATFAAVARTIRQLRSAGAEVALRATITPPSVQRQAEIVSFFYREFGVTDIRFEPAYQAGGGRQAGEAFRPGDASLFASHFLAAQRLAQVLGCRLELSGVRLHELHGPYCDVLRKVLRVTPDGTATACFLSTDGRTEPGAALIVGRPDHDAGRFLLDRERIDAVRRRALAVPNRCQTCVNIHHCARDCPEVCPVVETDPRRIEEPGFRCQVQKILGETWIREAPWPCPEPLPDLSAERTTAAGEIGEFLAGLPPEIDADGLVRQWSRASSAFSLASRTMPRPPWSERGFEDDPDQAWECIGAELQSSQDSGAVSGYVHIPFCDRKCAFCDCYALYMDPGQRRREGQYIDALLREVEAWQRWEGLRSRPATTIHFGGGTPNYTTPGLFARLLQGLRELFAVTGDTEWALESTSTQLTPEHLDQLAEWGFRRLHVGVQTFHDARRKAIGRREDTRTVLGKIRLALERGFIVSIDLIYGLPGQTLHDFLNDIETGVSAGIDGCSLYHLNASARNRSFIQGHAADQRSTLVDYLYFQAGEQLLRARGYRKNHFAHFARPRDRNLYYTHVVRNEDLIALGTSADGSVGDYTYRHPALGQYLMDTTGSRPALEGGLREDRLIRLVRPASAALMTGRIDVELLRPLDAVPLIERWLDLEMIEPTLEAGQFLLTANGSWFLSRLLGELMECARDRDALTSA